MLLLSSKDIKSLLLQLDVDEIQNAIRLLEKNFAMYSKEQKKLPGAVASTFHQPMRISVNSKSSTCLIMPCGGEELIVVKSINVPQPHTAAPFPPRGSLSIYSGQTGEAIALMSAEEITAWRTALVAASVLVRRKQGTVKTIACFGAGNVARWMILLAKLLRIELSKAYIINRTSSTADTLAGSLESQFQQYPSSGPPLVLETIGLSDRRQVARAVNDADFIFTATSSKEALFELSDMTTSKPRYIAAVGSHTTAMHELPSALVRKTVSEAGNGSLLLVDSQVGCLKEAGELIREKVKLEDVTELGEALDDAIYTDRLQFGDVLMKSVGTALTDFTAGVYLVERAKRYNAGTQLDEF